MVTSIFKPNVIAHRGASGYLPEHTLEAKIVAHWQGADYLEQDVVATGDGELIVFHDINLESITDVATLYPNRQREDGHYYAVDFLLSEIRTLTVSQRDDQGNALSANFTATLPELSERFAIPTLAEEIDLIQELNRLTGRSVGIYPELKNPAWHRDHGIDLARSLLDILSAAGYNDATDAIFVQCFDPSEIRRLREELGTRVRLVQLVYDDENYSNLLDFDGLRELAEFAQGLGPGFDQLVDTGVDGAVKPSPLFQLARDNGLELHPYTFRRRNLPDYAESLEALLSVFFTDIPVDAVFCDYPDVAVRVRDSVLGLRR